MGLGSEHANGSNKTAAADGKLPSFDKIDSKIDGKMNGKHAEPNGKSNLSSSEPNGKSHIEPNGSSKTGTSKSSSSGSKTAPSSSSLGARNPQDVIQRGIYKSNPLGTAAFIGLRALDPILQYKFLAGDWGTRLLSKLNISSIPLYDYLVETTTVAGTKSVIIRYLPLPRLILLLMSAGSSLKQIYWLLGLSREELTPAAAVEVSLFNTVVNTLGSLLLLGTSTSASLSTPRITLPFSFNSATGTSMSLPLPIAIGSIMYITGMAIETLTERTRKKFKDDEANEGKICREGLWSKARHINYGGYTLWRSGYALAAGGWIPALGVAAFHIWHFVSRSTVYMSEYMQSRYGDQWEKYKEDVPYLLIPGIY
jgi:protein-S-isoprenylcysteine O-methyltransferase Ste14